MEQIQFINLLLTMVIAVVVTSVITLAVVVRLSSGHTAIQYEVLKIEIKAVSEKIDAIAKRT